MIIKRDVSVLRSSWMECSPTVPAALRSQPHLAHIWTTLNISALALQSHTLTHAHTYTHTHGGSSLSDQTGLTRRRRTYIKLLLDSF